MTKYDRCFFLTAGANTDLCHNNTWAGRGEITHPRCLRRLPREGGVGATNLSSWLRRYTNKSRPVRIEKFKYLTSAHRSADSQRRSPPLGGAGRGGGEGEAALLHILQHLFLLHGV